MNSQGGKLLLAFRFGRLAAGQGDKQAAKQQIDVETPRHGIHSAATQTEQPPDVKIDMGQQSNKIQKRHRREAYLKRKSAARKAKLGAKATKA